jgi:predicted transcriptional regulator
MRLSESEWQIMNALWTDHPATAREVADNLPAEVSWAYTTIKTMLSRLVGKGAVSETKRGNTSVYRPLVSRRRARRAAVGKLLETAFDGTLRPLVSFLAEETELSAEQRRELIEILEAEDRNEGEVD